MASNWAILEYDAESYPPEYSVAQSTPGFILDQYLTVYAYRPHVINFFLWEGVSSDAHTIKGTNKEPALRDFITAVRDLARDTDLNKHYSPPKVASLSGVYSAPGTALLTIASNIWSGEDWEWKQWGDFSHFKVFRSTEAGFTPGPGTLLDTTADYEFSDTSLVSGIAYFYRVCAVSTQSAEGPLSDEIIVISSSSPESVLHVDKKNLNFGAVQGGSSSPSEAVTVRNIGSPGTSIHWTTSPMNGWLLGTPGSGTGNGVVTVSVNASGLSRGAHAGEIWIEDPGAFNSPQIIQVRLEVLAQGEDKLPFGTFDTPREGVTVSGNIPVTGWALDDVGVSKVEIKRSPHPNDPRGAIGPDGLVFVGKAYFVRGARPDVAAAYPDYPANDRAGWGCMVLTNFLPGQGNGDFTLHAIATDTSGRQKKLGQKLIHCDNANRTKPFGAIDTPPLGGIVSGTDYANFAWSLTPLPKMIPVDGSTLWVYLDGVPLGHPVYNLYRPDIATLFPGYMNSDGAVGLFHLDTTSYSNGVHMLAWSMRDNQGAVDGMSRYFEIQNLESTALTQSYSVNNSNYANGIDAALDIKGRIRTPRLRSTAGIPRASEGRQRSRSTPAAGSKFHGRLAFTIKELERVEIELDFAGGCEPVGWGADKDQGLPIGSTLDAQKGVFYWSPGPGFLGEHVLHFAAVRDGFHGKPLKVIIRIEPKN
jgi:hypothetical protein